METTVCARTRSVAPTQLTVAYRSNLLVAQSPIQLGRTLGDQLGDVADLAFAGGRRASLVDRSRFLRAEVHERLSPFRAALAHPKRLSLWRATELEGRTL